MPARHRMEFQVDAPPEAVLSFASDVKSFTALWAYLESLDTTRIPPVARMKVKRFGVSLTNDYELTVEIEKGKVTYTGDGKDRKFNIVVEAKPRVDGGSDVAVEVSYSGPFESLSDPVVKGLAESIARGLRAAAGGFAHRGMSILRDPYYTVNIIATGKILIKRVYHIKDQSDFQMILFLISELSRGNPVFASLQTQDARVRLLARMGEIVDAVVEVGGQVFEGPSSLGKAVDALKGKNVEAIVIQAPGE